MIEVARVTGTSRRSARQFFDRWIELETHPEWSAGMEYLRLREPLVLGARGELKTRAGEPAEFEVTELIDGSVYADTTMLDGARLTVRHEARASQASGAELTVSAVVTGPRERYWAEQFGDSVERDLRADLSSLIALLEKV